MSSTHRRELDGLRTVAVMIVLAFHAGLRGADGGFIGVDTFFVLSGFLITGLLLSEARTGHIDLVGFYARRSRRLLPAALVAVIGTSVAWLLTSSVIVRHTLVDDARAASLYVANWHFIRQATDYFASGGAESPFLHFWSLAAEEQFYFVWPAVLVAVVAIARRRGRLARLAVVVRCVTMVLGAASLVSLIVTTAAGNEALAYFGTHHRVYQLMAGASLATVDWAAVRPGLRRAGGPLATVGLVGLLVLATSLVDAGPGARGAAATVAAVLLIVGLTAGTPGAAASRLLSTAPMARVGMLSYGVYLWHWPVILLLQRFVTERRIPVTFLAAIVSIGLAWLSHLLIERHVRFSPRLQRHHRAVIAGGLALSALVGLVAAPAALDVTSRPMFVSDEDTAAFDRDELATITSPSTTTGTGVPDSTLPIAAPSVQQVLDATTKGPALTCVDSLGRACLVHHGNGATVLVVGDSHLHAFKNEFAHFAVDHDLTMWIAQQDLCPWLPNVVEAGSFKKACGEMHRAVFDDLLPALRPDTVIVLNRAYDDPLKSTTLIGPDGELAEASDVLVSELPHAIEQVLDSTSRLVIVQPWPSLAVNQRACLATVDAVIECTTTAAPRPLPSDAVADSIAAHDSRVTVVSITDLVCPRMPICDPVVGGEVVRTDTNHLNRAFAVTIIDELLDRLTAVGAFDRAT